MTMAFAIVSFSAVNLGLVMRREREPAWSRPLFPYLGWIILGWVLTWAAVELGMFQRLLNTESLTGGQWLVVLALSLAMPAAVGVDKAIALHRQRDPAAATATGMTPGTTTGAAVVVPSPRPGED
jgi:Ca2+-transporting ATPase